MVFLSVNVRLGVWQLRFVRLVLLQNFLSFNLHLRIVWSVDVWLGFCWTRIILLVNVWQGICWSGEIMPANVWP